jgi:phosphoglycolate phosphatase-like HAD superfamily hydrolase
MKKFLVVWDFNGVINRFQPADFPLLQDIVQRGGQNIIVSQSHPAVLEQFVTMHQLRGIVQQVYGTTPDKIEWVGDSAEGKAETILDHIKKFGPFETIILIGDSESDIRAGAKVGATCLLYSPQMQSFETSADSVITSFSEIMSLLPPQ